MPAAVVAADAEDVAVAAAGAVTVRALASTSAVVCVVFPDREGLVDAAVAWTCFFLFFGDAMGLELGGDVCDVSAGLSVAGALVGAAAEDAAEGAAADAVDDASAACSLACFFSLFFLLLDFASCTREVAASGAVWVSSTNDVGAASRCCSR